MNLKCFENLVIYWIFHIALFNLFRTGAIFMGIEIAQLPMIV